VQTTAVEDRDLRVITHNHEIYVCHQSVAGNSVLELAPGSHSYWPVGKGDVLLHPSSILLGGIGVHWRSVPNVTGSDSLRDAFHPRAVRKFHLHDELVLLVEAGLIPLEAIASATSVHAPERPPSDHATDKGPACRSLSNPKHRVE
jgi:hypothetical protein